MSSMSKMIMASKVTLWNQIVQSYETSFYLDNISCPGVALSNIICENLSALREVSRTKIDRRTNRAKQIWRQNFVSTSSGGRRVEWDSLYQSFPLDAKFLKDLCKQMCHLLMENLEP